MSKLAAAAAGPLVQLGRNGASEPLAPIRRRHRSRRAPAGSPGRRATPTDRAAPAPPPASRPASCAPSPPCAADAPPTAAWPGRRAARSDGRRARPAAGGRGRSPARCAGARRAGPARPALRKPQIARGDESKSEPAERGGMRRRPAAGSAGRTARGRGRRRQRRAAGHSAGHTRSHTSAARASRSRRSSSRYGAAMRRAAGLAHGAVFARASQSGTVSSASISLIARPRADHGKPVAGDQHLRHQRPGVVGRTHHRAIGPGDGERDEVAFGQRRQRRSRGRRCRRALADRADDIGRLTAKLRRPARAPARCRADARTAPGGSDRSSPRRR